LTIGDQSLIAPSELQLKALPNLLRRPAETDQRNTEGISSKFDLHIPKTMPTFGRERRRETQYMD
jgi:hypothetical protein